jgi:amidase
LIQIIADGPPPRAQTPGAPPTDVPRRPPLRPAPAGRKADATNSAQKGNTGMADTASDPLDLSLTGAAAGLASGALSPVSLTEAALERIAAVDGKLLAYQTVMADQARAEAKAREAELKRGISRGPLHGVPIAVKDLCTTHDAPTAAGMKLHEGNRTDTDCTVVERLRRAGAVLLGKLAMTEGAFAGHHPEMRTPKNPFAPEVWSGASSSGSGAATAAGLCFGSTGSDTGGSIRFPSHANGIAGLKPTWGRVSRAGVFALADSLDHVGPMCRTAADCAPMLAAMAGADPRDPTASAHPVGDYMAAVGAPVRGLRLGVDRAALAGLDAETGAAMEAALSALSSVGLRIVEVSQPSTEGLTDAWNAICGAETLVAHRETWPSRKAEYGPVLAGFLEASEGLSGVDLAAAMQRRLVWEGGFEKTMQDVDLLFLPVLSGVTYTVAEFEGYLAGEATGDEGIGDLVKFTSPTDMTGSPALTMPAGFDKRGAPIGCQLIGHHFAEATLIAAGCAFQSVTDHHAARPDLSPFRG